MAGPKPLRQAEPHKNAGLTAHRGHSAHGAAGWASVQTEGLHGAQPRGSDPSSRAESPRLGQERRWLGPRRQEMGQH